MELLIGLILWSAVMGASLICTYERILEFFQQKFRIYYLVWGGVFLMTSVISFFTVLSIFYDILDRV